MALRLAVLVATALAATSSDDTTTQVAEVATTANAESSGDGASREDGKIALEKMVAQIDKQLAILQADLKERLAVDNLIDNFDGVSSLADQIKDLDHYAKIHHELLEDVIKTFKEVDEGRYEDAAGGLAEMSRLKCLASFHFKVNTLEEELEEDEHDKKYSDAHALVSKLKEMAKVCEKPAKTE